VSVAAPLVFVGGLFLFLWGGGLVARVAGYLSPDADCFGRVQDRLADSGAPSWFGANGNWLVRNDLESMATGMTFIPVALSASIVLVLLFWSPRPSPWTKVVWPFCPLLIIGPISALNFMYGDCLMRVWVQELFNIVMVFFGLVSVLTVRDLRTASHYGAVGKGMATFLISAFVVAIPAMYAGAFVLIRSGVLPPRTTATPVAPLLGTLVGAAVGVLNTVKSWSPPRTQPPSMLVVPGRSTE
jgi:hypothetical protein